MHRFQENRLFKQSNNETINTLQNALKSFFFYLFRMFPVNNKKIVFQSFKGLGFCDSPKYIYQETHKQHLICNPIWITKKEYIDQFPEEIKLVPYNTIRSIYELSTAKIWIDNCRKESNVKKRNNQFYIETWHNGISLKQVEKSVENKLSERYVKNAKHDSKLVDIFISNSSFSTQRYRKDFWYDGKIVEFGLPRNDIFFQNDEHINAIKKKVFEYFKIRENTKVLLYAPTFRKSFNIDCYINNLDDVLVELKNKFSGEWVAMIHYHPNIVNNRDSIHNPHFINSNYYPDFQEILLSCSVLITDYSSTMFEFSFNSRPVFLYMSDYNDYKNDRDFEFNIQELPYPIATNKSELISTIRSFDNNSYCQKVISFFNEIALYEYGNSSEKIVEIIKGVLKS